MKFVSIIFSSERIGTLICGSLLLLNSASSYGCSISFSDGPPEFTQPVTNIVKGYFKPLREGEECSRFLVTKSYDKRYQAGNSYSVTTYGKFGAMCEEYELETCLTEFHVDQQGRTKKRFLVLESNLGDGERLVTSHYYGDEGILIDFLSKEVVFRERYSVDLETFEAYLEGKIRSQPRYRKLQRKEFE